MNNNNEKQALEVNASINNVGTENFFTQVLNEQSSNGMSRVYMAFKPSLVTSTKTKIDVQQFIKLRPL
ncbi:MAG: hypothetical protein OSB25_04665 [Salibacteraceae bacterium]|nr:hypothetical protein [Salibacteraceae bacterium]|tara:strand:- start:30666 stop:30869 length:204 start_codon:yes stop_codon:yes gene_type:complete